MGEAIKKALELAGWYCAPPPDGGDGGGIDTAGADSGDQKTLDGDATAGDGADDSEAGDAAKTDEALKGSDDDGEGDGTDKKIPEHVPYARFVEVNNRSKDLETKLDQFKRLGAEGYYKLYPEEAPADDADAGAGDDTGADAEPEPVKSLAEMGEAVVTGGPYHGKTLSEVAKIDPLAAMDLYNGYRESVQAKQTESQKLREESQRELATFADTRAQELFGKEAAKLTATERQQLDALADTVTTWMIKTGRGGGIIEDAFFLMKKDDLLKDAKSSAVRALVEKLKDGGVKTMSSGNGGSKPTTGYARFAGMSPEQVAREMEAMSDAENDEFLKKAPEEVRKKFPALPWG